MTRIFTLFFCLACIAGCVDHHIAPDNKPDLKPITAVQEHVASSTTEFAFKLFNRFQSDTPENTFISPLSVSTALAMVLNGASEETQKSIINTIDFSGYSPAEINQAYKDLVAALLAMDNKVELGIANSAWFAQQYAVKPDFVKTIQTYYSGNVQGLDFSTPAAKDVINDWVADKTNDRIKNLIEAINPEEVMFLINAIYFKGEWTTSFNPENTRKANFIRLDGSLGAVDMMYSSKIKLKFYRGDETLVLDIPYGNKQFSLTILMPDQPVNYKQTVTAYTTEQINEWLAEADTTTAILFLPKFKMAWKKELRETLKSMGMKTTGFPELFEEQLPLEISRVVHQSFLEVNEKGAEAAAATAIGIGVTSLPSNPMFAVNKPFLFMIREKHTGIILFMGQLTNPDALEQ